MGALLPLLMSLFSGAIQPLKDWLSYKSESLLASRDLELARLAAEKEAITSGNRLRMAQLNATSKYFKEFTFWMICTPLFISMFFPHAAATMWNNFEAMPAWYQWLFTGVVSAIWGLPVAGGSIMSFLNNHTERQVAKIKAINETEVAKSLRSTIFKQGMTQEQWNAIHEALVQGESMVEE